MTSEDRTRRGQGHSVRLELEGERESRIYRVCTDECVGRGLCESEVARKELKGGEGEGSVGLTEGRLKPKRKRVVHLLGKLQAKTMSRSG